MSRTQLIIPVSRSLQEHIESFGIKNDCRIVSNVINTDFFSFKSENFKKDKKRIIFIGALLPYKGIPYLLEAMEMLRDIRGDFCLDIVGDGIFMEDYKKMTNDKGLTDRVTFHGTKYGIEKLGLLQKSDFMVLPSLYESFGVVLIEAMACGKPVITTLNGGQKEFVNEDNGVLVPAKNSRALARAIEYLLDHHQDYSSDRIARYARDNYSYATIGRSLHDIYVEVTNEWK